MIIKIIGPFPCHPRGRPIGASLYRYLFVFPGWKYVVWWNERTDKWCIFILYGSKTQWCEGGGCAIEKTPLTADEDDRRFSWKVEALDIYIHIYTIHHPCESHPICMSRFYQIDGRNWYIYTWLVCVELKG